MDWKRRAACIDLDMHDWYGENVTLGMARLCVSCPVRLDCIGEALQRVSSDDAGVWAGTTTADRHRIRQRKITIESVWDDLRSLIEYGTGDDDVRQVVL